MMFYIMIYIHDMLVSTWCSSFVLPFRTHLHWVFISLPPPKQKPQVQSLIEPRWIDKGGTSEKPTTNLFPQRLWNHEAGKWNPSLLDFWSMCICFCITRYFSLDFSSIAMVCLSLSLQSSASSFQFMSVWRQNYLLYFPEDYRLCFSFSDFLERLHT